jgi:serine protease Do
LGVSVRGLTTEDRTRFQLAANEAGVLVTAVDPSSDLADKGVRPGDVILQAGGHAVRTSAELDTAAAAARHAGRPLLLQITGRAGRRFIATDVTPPQSGQ